MAQLNYQYQGGTRVRPPRRNDSGRFRLLLISIVIALITAGIICLLLPKKTAEVKKTAAADAGTAASAPQAVKPAEQPAAAEVKKAAPVSAKKAEKTNVPGEKFTPADFPEKGKPWKGDAPETPPLIPEKGENSAAWRSEAQQLTAKHLSAIAKRSDIPGFTIRHTVKSGENFSRIASKNHTTYEMIKLLSGFSRKHNANRLNVGQNLRLLPGPWHIVIEKEAKLLKLYAVRDKKEKLFAVWDIGIGRQKTTPAGEFVVCGRIYNPSWTAPDGSIIAFGKPENPLGTRFLKLARQATPTQPANGLGIHGTNDEASVTKSLSSGCIRMRNADVEILTSIVPSKTRVTIKN